MRVLILNQAFYPDTVSTAQHASDLASGLASRGHSVTVVASRRGYDDPQRRFPKHELWREVEVRRIACTGFGKKAKWRRAVDFSTFMMSCAGRVLVSPRFDIIVAMTSPPLISSLAALFVPLRASYLVSWVMDLNPDEAIAAGWLKAGSLGAKILRRSLNLSLRRAVRVIVLDRFMRDRLVAKRVPERKITIIPPWSHNEHVRFDPEGRDDFRRRHGLTGKFVVMYAGNHSPCHPPDILLEAATGLRNREEIVFCFVGGGSEFGRLKRYASANTMSNTVFLPYEPLQKLAGVLSSADLHVVLMGDAFPGIVHPCKIYNILSVGIPLLYVGPSQSHLHEIVDRLRGAGHAYSSASGAVNDVIENVLVAAGKKAGSVAEHREASVDFSQEVLLPRFIGELENLPIPVMSAGAQSARE